MSLNTGYTYHCNVNVTEETVNSLQNNIILLFRIQLLNLKKVAIGHKPIQTQKAFAILLLLSKFCSMKGVMVINGFIVQCHKF